MFLIFILALQACTHQQLTQKQAETNRQTQRSDPTLIEQWCMTGRSAAKYADSGWQAGVHWCQADNHSKLELSGPMRLGTVLLSYHLGELWIRESADHVSITHQPQRLLEARLGFSVPLSALKFWLMGLAEPGAIDYQQRDSEGQLSLLHQHDWVVKYDNYTMVDGYQLPGKIKLTKDAVSLKIVVDKWQLGE
ncbi:MAG: lipoprotein insertase outer membrane protein LolB [Methylococcales bacterium]